LWHLVTLGQARPWSTRAHAGYSLIENIATPYVFIATQVVNMHSRFITKPALRGEC
jgi:hypothetical protein